MNRALRYDGLLAYTSRGEVTPEDIRAIKEYVKENKGADDTFDIVWEGMTPGDDPERAASVVRPLAEAGAAGRIASSWLPPNTLEDRRRRIGQGPPRIEP